MSLVTLPVSRSGTSESKYLILRYRIQVSKVQYFLITIIWANLFPSLSPILVIQVSKVKQIHLQTLPNCHLHLKQLRALFLSSVISSWSWLGHTGKRIYFIYLTSCVSNTRQKWYFRIYEEKHTKIWNILKMRLAS